MRTTIYEFSPAGTAEGCPGLRRGLRSAVPPGLVVLSKSNPGLTSWAKFSRPCGTELDIGPLDRGKSEIKQRLKIKIPHRGTVGEEPGRQLIRLAEKRGIGSPIRRST